MRTINGESPILDLLRKAKAENGIKSDYALAKALGVSQAQVSRWKDGTRTPGDYACLRLSELSGEPLDMVVAAAAFQRAENDHQKHEWAVYLGKLVVLCTWAACLFAGAGLSPTAAAAHSGGDAAKPRAVCIMSTALRRLWQRFCPRGFGGFPAFGS